MPRPDPIRSNSRRFAPPGAVLLFAVAAVAGAQDVPSYRAGRALDEIHVDGRLDEFTWAAAPRLGAFTDIRDAASDEFLTQAAIAWDDQYFYAAFVCVDSEPWGTLTERDAHLWEEEVVEVFLDPQGDGENYPELEVSPDNVVVDLLIPAPGRVSADEAARWDIAGLRTAVARHARGWTVEIAIPWASLSEAGVEGPPKIGERWRVGMYRIERPGGPERARRSAEARRRGDEAEVERLTADHRFLAWSKTERSFHEPEKFGIVEFAERPWGAWSTKHLSRLFTNLVLCDTC